MKYSQIRIALLTFTLGLVSITFVDFLQEKRTVASTELPKSQTTTPIVVFQKYHREIGDRGGSSCGGTTCKDFIKSLGKLTKAKRQLIAESPCNPDLYKNK